ncbi:MAG: hypothetical protein NTW91_10660, partial [Verrucomicrobia bacterium]|nr:hypothetical protein [Verrucomicrobiota bacterium]
MAKKYGIFDQDWYRAVNADIDFSEIDPFKHYVVHGWRQGRNPAPNFHAGMYSSIASDFRSKYENPVIDAIQRLNQGRLKKSDLKRLLHSAHSSPRKEVNLKGGISVSGFLKSEIGLGQAVRNLVHSIDKASIPSSLHDFPLKGRASEMEFSNRCVPLMDRRCNLIVTAMTELPIRSCEMRGDTHNILYPAWELSRIDPNWVRYIQKYSEVWTPSTFVANMFTSLGVKVTIVRQPVLVRPATDDITVSLEKNDKSMGLLTYYDFDSSVARKNIKGPIIAFQKAFPSQRDVTLTVKVRGHDDQGARG